MVFVRDIGSVRYYDDSKGTNVGASVTAVLGISEPKVVLIAGGRDKGGSYGPLVEALRERGRAAVLIGEAADLIQRAVGDAIPVSRAASMDEAVTTAASLARAGDAVLLSPACSSFDMFRDYKERGDAFVRAVLALPGASR
jgi:UDP-N-acetylmuramoylalanine--D-glutamate ligase